MGAEGVSLANVTDILQLPLCKKLQSCSCKPNSRLFRRAKIKLSSLACGKDCEHAPNEFLAHVENLS